MNDQRLEARLQCTPGFPICTLSLLTDQPALYADNIAQGTNSVAEAMIPRDYRKTTCELCALVWIRTHKHKPRT